MDASTSWRRAKSSGCSVNEKRPTVGEYCRAIEAHLCRRNGGHLIRVVGPAFEMVRGWEAMGVPLAIALRGMDRYFDRIATRAPRRRPARVEFCEADVMELFDEWRRAVGVGVVRQRVTGSAATEAGEPRARRGPSLTAHLDRVLVRLTSTLATTELDERLRDTATHVLHAAGEMRATARGLRGEARARALERLVQLDDELMRVAVDSVPPALAAEIEAACRRDLAPFATRMSPSAMADAMATAKVHATRERLGLPRVAME